MKKLLLILLCFNFIFSCKNPPKNTIEERNSADTLRDFLFQAINNTDEELMQTYVDLSNFEIIYDQINVKDADTSSPSYSFDTIKYISPYLCIYVKSGQHYLYSHRGKHLDLPGLKEHQVHYMFYNEDCELYYPMKGTRTIFEVYKFNLKRSLALSEPGILGGTVYSIDIQVTAGGVVGDYGPVCTVTTPQASFVISNPQKVLGQEKGVIFETTLFPNPFNDVAVLNINSDDTNAPVSVFVYDGTGRLIESRLVDLTQETDIRIGTEYNSGFYQAIIIQNGNKKTARIVKQ